MKRSRKTKGTLLVSALSLLLCVAMLVGSTFAWFTDSVATGTNKIISGTLDVELSAKVDGTYTPVTADTNLFLKDALWEPGHVEIVNLKVENIGTLALQYKFGINVADEKPGINTAGKEFNLSDSIRFALIEGEKTYGNRADAIADAEANGSVKLSELALNKKAVLYPAAKATPENPAAHLVTLVVYMPTSVGNEANYRGTQIPEITLGVNLFATQTPFEYDSFRNDYDIAADPDYDPFAEADAEALAKGMAYRKADGTYGTLSASQQISFLLDTAKQGTEVTLIKDIGAPSKSSSSLQMDYSGKQSVLDLHGNTYTFGKLELKQDYNKVSQDSSLVIKDGTMMGTINFEEIFKSYNAMQTITLDHVNMKWDNPRAWNADKNNYRGLILATKTAGSVFTVKDSVLDCNASFYTTANGSDLEPRAVANVTNTTVNGRLHGAGLTLNVDGCTVNGEVYCNASNSSKTDVKISNSTINGNAFFSASSSVKKNDVTISNTVINGNLQTSSTANNIHITLTDVTVTGTLGYNNSSWNVPADRVTIVSGNYGFDPTNYLASGSTVAYNEATGIWVVTAG